MASGKGKVLRLLSGVLLKQAAIIDASAVGRDVIVGDETSVAIAAASRGGTCVARP